MNRKLLNLHAQLLVAEDSADFNLLISATGPHGNLATIGNLSIDDPELGPKLRLITQAFRMGARYGNEES